MSERQLDEVIDHLSTLNDTTPKIKCQGRNGVDPALIFGLQTQLFIKSLSTSGETDAMHHDEVETVTLYSGGIFGRPLHHSDSCHHEHSVSEGLSQTGKELEHKILIKALQALSKENIWRVKGFVRLIKEDSEASTIHILNWAFGRYELSAVRSENGSQYLGEGEVVRLTVMGERGEVARAARRLAEEIGASVGG